MNGDKYYFHGEHWQNGPIRVDGFTDPEEASSAAEKYVDEHGSGLNPDPPIVGHEDDYSSGVFRNGNRYLNVMREPPAWRVEQEKTSSARPWETTLTGDLPFFHVTRRPGPISELPASRAGESGPGVYLAENPEYAQQMASWDPRMRTLNVTVHAGDGLRLLDRTKPGGEDEYRRIQLENMNKQDGLAELLQSHGYDGVRNLSPGNKYPETVIHDPAKLRVSEPPDDKQSALKFASLAMDAGEPDFLMHVQARWADVRNKAKEIRASGGVKILAFKNGTLVGHVKGASQIYESTIVFVPGSRTTGSWSCGCAWAAYSWGRTGQWKKFEGRRCSHVLALQFEAQSREWLGKDLHLDIDTPHWNGGADVVKVPGEWDRDVAGYPEKPDTRPLPRAAALGTPEQQEQLQTMQERGLPQWIKGAPLLSPEELTSRDADESLVGDLSSLSDRHRSAIHHQLSMLPEHDKKVMREYGVKINAFTPTKDDRTLSYNGAVYNPGKKAVELDARGDYPRWMTHDQSNVILHELGHALDYAKDRPSQSGAYKSLFPRGTKMHTKNHAEEVFAEAYAATHGGYEPQFREGKPKRGFELTPQLKEIAQGISEAPYGTQVEKTAAATEDLGSSPYITRGFKAEPDYWEKGAAERIRDHQATAEDILKHIDTGSVGDFWHGHADSTPEAQDYAWVEPSDHVGTAAQDPEELGYTDGKGYLGQVGVTLVAHRPSGWDPNTNEPEMGGLMGNSYLSHATDLKLHEIHYSDHEGNWHVIPAEGHSVHATGYLDRSAAVTCPSDGQELEYDPMDGYQHLDGSISHDDGLSVTDHLQQAGIPLTPESTNLASALAFSSGMARSLHATAKVVGRYRAGLDQADTEGPNAVLAMIQDELFTAGNKMTAVHGHLQRAAHIQDAQNAVDGRAGKRELYDDDPGSSVLDFVAEASHSDPRPQGVHRDEQWNLVPPITDWEHETHIQPTAEENWHAAHGLALGERPLTDAEYAQIEDEAKYLREQYNDGSFDPSWR